MASTLPPLATTDDVALILGRPLTTEEVTRANQLLPIASDLVRDECCQTFTLTDPDTGAVTANAPTTVEMVVAQMVAEAIKQGDVSSDGIIRAETIGDYRVEYEPDGGVSAGMSVGKFAPSLARWNLCSMRTLTTPLAFDGVAAEVDAL